MADTSIFEVARATHEEVERYEQAIVDLLLSSSSAPTTSALSAAAHKDQLKKDHKISELLDRIVQRKHFLKELYDDQQGELAKERELLLATTQDASGKPDTLGEFYRRVDRIKDYHKKYPQSAPEAFVVDFSGLESSSGLPEEGRRAAALTGLGGLDFVDRMFSGEEASGRFMDLYVQHDLYMNLKAVRRCPYVLYLDQFDKLSGESSKIPVEAKRTEPYRKYLASLNSYLSNFLRKTRPLFDVDAVEAAALAQFEEDWSAGRVEGWGAQGSSTKATATTAADATRPEGQGIWCDACRRYYSKQTVYDAHLKSPKHQKAAERLAKATSGGQEPAAAGGSDERHKATARQEALIVALAQELDGVRKETKSNIERRAALTERERQAEAEMAEQQYEEPEPANAGAAAGEEDDADGDDERIYNPLRLPLGWDGKPIPYWLYKLHGLGQDFKCEICSDVVYQGRKNFEKHFQESRHAFGMRALGLPNTKHFAEITKIADALALAEKLKKQGRALAEEQGDAEEVEDEHGNTYSRKTYELMKRQGLI